MLDGIHGNLTPNMVMLVLRCHVGGKEFVPLKGTETGNVLLSPAFLIHCIQYLLDSILITVVKILSFLSLVSLNALLLFSSISGYAQQHTTNDCHC